jgi:hypothetical protein
MRLNHFCLQLRVGPWLRKLVGFVAAQSRCCGKNPERLMLSRKGLFAPRPNIGVARGIDNKGRVRLIYTCYQLLETRCGRGCRSPYNAAQAASLGDNYHAEPPLGLHPPSRLVGLAAR